MERNSLKHINKDFLMKGIILIIAFMFIFNTYGCASNDKIEVRDEISIKKSTPSYNKDENSYDLFPEYHIAPGDVLDVLFLIVTWAERETFKVAIDHTLTIRFPDLPELDQTQRVLPDGTISLPYLGSVRVIDKTIDELTDLLIEKYSGILLNPDLYIIVPEFRSPIKELKTDLHTSPRGLSRLVKVRPDGFVTFPILGDVFIAGKTIPGVNKHLNKLYDELLPGLHVDLFLESH